MVRGVWLQADVYHWYKYEANIARSSLQFSYYIPTVMSYSASIPVSDAAWAIDLRRGAMRGFGGTSSPGLPPNLASLLIQKYSQKQKINAQRYYYRQAVVLPMVCHTNRMACEARLF